MVLVGRLHVNFFCLMSLVLFLIIRFVNSSSLPDAGDHKYYINL